MSKATGMDSLLLALDLGTTTLAGRLLTADGRVLAEARSLNPQQECGSDVIRRLEAALAGEGERLQRLLCTGIAALVARLRAESGVAEAPLRAAAVAANPAIATLLLGADPHPILFPPHRPQERAGRWLPGGSLPLALDCPLYLFPLVSGYVGGDLVAFLYGQVPSAAAGATTLLPTLFIDIGTNAEMALWTGTGWLVTSVAAGPAFEGAGMACGMLAVPGAISGVTLQGDRLQLTVIGGGSPQGVCGSGLAEAIAAGRAGGLVDASGRIVDPDEVATNLAQLIVPRADGHAVRLYRDARTEVLLSQADVRAFQLAKGAVQAGAVCLLQRAGLAAAALEQVVVTGAFGLALQPQTVKTVAMLPADMVEKSFFLAGGALAGASRLLREENGPGAVAQLAAQLKPYPLSGTPAFEQAFLAALDF